MVPSRLRRAAAGLAALALLTSGLTVSAQEKKGGDDKDRLQGTWEVVRAEKGGEKLPEELTRAIKVTFKGDTVRLAILGEAKEGMFKLDQKAKPKAIDMTLEGMTARGIYKLDNKELTIAAAEPGQARPREFDEKGLTTVVLRQVDAAKPDKKEKKQPASGDKKGDQALAQGDWVVVSVEKGGEKLPDEVTKSIKLTIKGDKFTLVLPDETKEGTIKLDPTKKPKTVDVSLDGQTIQGLYELTKDRLKIVAGEPGQARPEDFQGAQHAVVVFKRAAAAKKEESEEQERSGEPKPAKGSLDGTWTVVSAEKGGEKLPDELIKTVKLTFKGKKLTFELLGEKKEGSFKIDSTKKPATIDLMMEDKTAPGIYQLDGDTLKICAAEPGEARPKDFKADAGNRMLVVLKRVAATRDKDGKDSADKKKDAAEEEVCVQDDKGKDDAAKLQGTWRVQTLTESGKAAPAEIAKKFKLVIDGERITLHGDSSPKDGTFKLDATKSPKHIDITIKDKQGLGIYKLQGDSLTLALGETLRGRPTAFASEEGSRIALVVLKRAAKGKKKEADKGKDESLRADGSVRRVGRNFDAPTLRAGITRSGGEVADLRKLGGGN